jgi:hypothetical protein
MFYDDFKYYIDFALKLQDTQLRVIPIPYTKFQKVIAKIFGLPDMIYLIKDKKDTEYSVVKPIEERV